MASAVSLSTLTPSALKNQRCLRPINNDCVLSEGRFAMQPGFLFADGEQSESSERTFPLADTTGARGGPWEHSTFSASPGTAGERSSGSRDSIQVRSPARKTSGQPTLVPKQF